MRISPCLSRKPTRKRHMRPAILPREVDAILALALGLAMMVGMGSGVWLVFFAILHKTHPFKEFVTIISRTVV